MNTFTLFICFLGQCHEHPLRPFYTEFSQCLAVAARVVLTHPAAVPECRPSITKSALCEDQGDGTIECRTVPADG